MTEPDPAVPSADLPPRPQYGEYATPEQQRAAIQQPLPGSGEAGPRAVSVATSEQPVTSRTRGSRTDRILTIALLAYGLVTVVAAVPQMLDYAGFVDAWREVAGVDAAFTNIEGGRRWGAIGAAVFAGGWLATALVSILQLRRGRPAWWMPLVGAIVAFAVVSVCLSVPILGDPGLMAHFSR